MTPPRVIIESPSAGDTPARRVMNAAMSAVVNGSPGWSSGWLSVASSAGGPPVRSAVGSLLLSSM